MFKTCISVPRAGQTPDIINHTLDVIGFHVDTIIYEPDKVSFYVSYKWYEYYKVYTFKKAVKNYAKRVKYYDRTSIPRYLFSPETRPSPDKFQKALAEFSYAAAVQGGIRCGDIEAIVNGDGIVIGYKRLGGN